jgi:uncharacterized protein YdaU (DUF1376 family)
MNYYKRHLGDYARDTGWLTTYQHGVYALLLDWYYANEKPIPLALAPRIVKARSGPEKRAVEEVISTFFDVSKGDGFAYSKRADLDIANYITKSLNNSLIAKDRESTKRARNVDDSESASCGSGEPSHKPLAISHKEEEKTRAPKVAKAKGVTLREWLADLGGEDAVPAADPIFEWGEAQGIPPDWLALAWFAFENRYIDDAKTYTDWRAVFRRALRDDWLRLWRNGRNGWELTTAGVQAEREMANVR